MTGAPGRQTIRPIVQRVGFQVAFVLAVALLPLTVISMVNSVRALAEMHGKSEAALTGETMLAATNEIRLIQEARGTASALAATIAPSTTDPAVCIANLKRLVAAQPQYSQISYVPRDGRIVCSSTGKTFDLSQNPVFQSVVALGHPGFTVNRNGPISGTSVLSISQPVVDAQGVDIGFISISLPHGKLDVLMPRTDGTGPLQLMTLDRDGQILVATGGLDGAAQNLPRDRVLKGLITDQPQAFSGLSQAGQDKVFSIVPLVPHELYLLGTWPADRAAGIGEMLVSVPLLFPALIWIACLIVAWLAVERLVNRHIRRFNTAINSFASGNRMTSVVDVAGAPLEIREMAAAFEMMTDSVMRDEAELEDTVHQKEVLMREVHHRVKNNLQMIASIMNMHLRKARTPETLEVIKGLQNRVMSLATIHRELYQTSGVSDVHAAELLDAIARQTVNVAAGPDRRVDLRTTLDDIRMTPDQAVPLALLLGEGLMNGVKYTSGHGGETTHFELVLSRSGPESAQMDIAVSIPGVAFPSPDAADENVGLSTQLMNAFAMQLGGKLAIHATEEKYHLHVDFKLRPLIEAEDRHAAKAEATA